MPETFGLIMVKLRRIFNSKTRPLHLKKELPPEFTVKPHLFNIKAFLSHVNKPFDNRLMLCNRRIRHSEPTVILPAEKWNVILFGFCMGRHNREQGMCDYNVNIFVSAI